ncbi:MAG: molybdenum cofactor guanylyltransferase [Thiobacillaceae bacterium]|nr:molybdenum cofactor guanylyltransferase [Thiobacillaceae bacterium]
MMLLEDCRVGAVILAGGRARRLGGRDKGLIPLCGRPLSAWVIERLRPQVDAIVLSANRNLAAYAALGHPVLADALPGHAGPLAGIAAAAGALRSAWLLTAPCDCPFLPDDLAARLLAGACAGGHAAVYAADPERAHYCVQLLRSDLLPRLRAYLDAGGRAAGAWLTSVGAAAVRFEDAQAFFNVNTPHDLAEAARLAGCAQG